MCICVEDGYQITIDQDKYDKILKTCLLMSVKIHNIVWICSKANGRFTLTPEANSNSCFKLLK